jgi:hypothetical protein
VFIIIIIYVCVSILGIVHYKNLSDAFKGVAWFLWFTSFIEIVMGAMAYAQIPNTPIAHIYTILIGPAYFLIYRHLLNSTSGWRWIQLLFILLFIFCIINSLILEKSPLMPTHGINADNLVVITCALLLYLKMLSEPGEKPLWYHSIFWLNTGIFFYNCSTFFVFTMLNHFYRNQYSTDLLSTTNFVMCCVFYIILGFSLWLNYRERKHG